MRPGKLCDVRRVMLPAILPNAAPSPSISSGLYPDIGSADPLAFIRAHPCASFFLHTLRVLITFLTRSISSAFFLLFLGICCRLLTRSNSRGYSRERFLASMRRASMRTFLPIPNAFKKNNIFLQFWLQNIDFR